MDTPRAERRYTLSEIDRMREGLALIAQCGARRHNHCWHHISVWMAGVEEKLRTCMVGGVTPEDIEAQAAAAKESAEAEFGPIHENAPRGFVIHHEGPTGPTPAYYRVPGARPWLA